MVRQVIPQGLAQMVPGPELAALLAGIDIHAVTGSDLVDVLCARSRQLAHDQAQFLATMVEVGLCDPTAAPGEVARLDEAPPYAADEIRAALAWTRVAADRELHFAETLVTRLPAVFTALDAGVICRSKAWLFADLCADLTQEQAEVVCDRLLPKAGELTTGELAARIKKLAIALDPEWAARRYASAVRDRNVVGYLDRDGTATVTGTRLPVEDAAAACARVEGLAKAAKRAGHPGRIGPLRADIYLGLLDGRWQHHDRDEIITDLLTRATPPPPDDNPNASERADGDPGDADSADSDSGGGANPAEPSDEGGPASADSPYDNTPDTPTQDDAPAAESPEADTGPAEPSHAPAPQPRPRVGVEVRVGLSTLLGRDRHPGEVPGWGPVTAETAHTIAATQRAAEWRYAITDPEGQLILAGITRRRPTTTPGDAPEAGPPCQGGIVELHIPATLLTDLTADPQACGGWAGVITDIAAQYAAYRDQDTPGARCAQEQDPGARFAGAVLSRHVQIRDRYCVHPGCRCPAHHADLDHTVDYAHGGPTTDHNTGPLCRHDHGLKHDGGWRLYQPEPGHFIWISPLGRTYHTRPQPITHDLPEPLPGPAYPDDLPPATAEDGPILQRPPPDPDPPPAPTVDPDEPPPF